MSILGLFFLQSFFFRYSSILIIKSIVFNISIDSSSLNIYLSLLSHLLQIVNIFLKNVWYFRVFKFSIFTTTNTIQYLNRFRVYWKCFSIILSLFSYSLGENKLIYSNKLLLFNIKSINPVKKYPHITESYACILKIFVVIFLLPMNFLISFGICSTPKLSKYVIISPFTYKPIQWVPTDLYLIYTDLFVLSSALITILPANIFYHNIDQHLIYLITCQEGYLFFFCFIFIFFTDTFY